MKWSAGALALLLAAVVAAVAVAAATTLSKPQYLAKLRAANAASARVDDAAGAAVASKTASPKKVRELLMQMGQRHVAIGLEFSTLAPPKAAAKANRDFAKAEIVFGRQNEAFAAMLPTKSRAAMLKYLHSAKPPSGGKLLDHAIAELHAAGFRI
jgi:hypothetical protein